MNAMTSGCTLRAAACAVALSAASAGAQERLTGVPFESDFGLVWVRTTVNGGEPLWFLLDTGFEYSLVNAAVARRLGLAIENPQLVPQPGGAVETGAVADVQLAFGPIRPAPLTLRAVPLTQLEPVVGRRLDGILGHDLVAQYRLTIDYERRILSFDSPGAEATPPDGTSLPLTIVADEPFVEAVIRQPHRPPISGRFKIDTGSLDAVGLNRNFLEAQDVLAPDQATRRIPGVAVGGETDGLLFRVQEFALGPFRLRQPMIGATLASAGFENRPDAGTIGAEVLSRFTVTLDYAHDRMGLVPNARFTDPPAADRCGMWVVADGEDFGVLRVRYVLADGPAGGAAIREGDVIVGVGGRPAAGLRLVDLWRACRAPAGAVLDLELRRGGETRTARLVLRDPV